jgi:hypothetical protein
VKLDATKIISLLILSTLALNLSTAYAHDPYAPEYWPTTFPVGQVDENFNELTADEWFIFIGLTVSVCLMISLPKLFDGENVNLPRSTFLTPVRCNDGRMAPSNAFDQRMWGSGLSGDARISDNTPVGGVGLHPLRSNFQGEICLRLTFPIG